MTVESRLGRRKARERRLRGAVRRERATINVRNAAANRVKRDERRAAVPASERLALNLIDRMSNWQRHQWVKAGRPGGVKEMTNFTLLFRLG